MRYVKEFEIEDLDDMLWAEAEKKWSAADMDTRLSVWERLEDFYDEYDEIPTEDDINQFIWHRCNDLFGRE